MATRCTGRPASRDLARLWTVAACGFAILGPAPSAQAQPAATTERAADAAPHAMPAARFQVAVEAGVPVSARDGVKLATDIYRPIGAAGRLPAVLIRTPYGKGEAPAAPWARFFAGQGYAVAVQDVRGKYQSEGVFAVMGHEAEDGYDTIDWLARRPWSNGRVGTFGCSYLGINQVMTSTLRPPALKAMIAMAAGGAVGELGGRYRQFGARHGGAVELAGSLQWFPIAGRKAAGAATPEALRAAGRIDVASASWRLPSAGALSATGHPDTDFGDFVGRPPADPWWRQFGYLDEKAEPEVPVLWVNSWYDYGVSETILLRDHYQRRSRSALARVNQPLLISPAQHCQSESLAAGAVVQGRGMGDPRYDYWGAYLAWFDRWLRPGAAQPRAQPPVTYFVMGANRWRETDQWPPAESAPAFLFLTSAGGANTRFGDGQLAAAPGPSAADSYHYDPLAPAPSVGGPFCCNGFPPSGTADPFDNRAAEARSDVLVYTSPPLAEALELSGPVDLTLFVSSNAPDTDFTAKLVEVSPDGRALALLETIHRARYREGYERPQLLQPGHVYKLRLHLGQISNRFSKGSRLRLEVSSSSFPRFDRNLNTGGASGHEREPVIAHNTIRHGAAFPSALRLSLASPLVFATTDPSPAKP